MELDRREMRSSEVMRNKLVRGGDGVTWKGG